MKDTQLEMAGIVAPHAPAAATPEGAAPQPEPQGAKISREAINLLPIRSYEGPIHLVDNEEGLKAACEALREERLLGFDTESQPVFRKGVSHPPALVQLAGSHAVYVFQLNKLNEVDGLRHVLADTHRKKAGVAIADDIKKLVELHPFRPAGFVEIGQLSRAAGLHQTGLRPLAAMLLGFRISKREQRSNWARKNLTTSQLRYAATDAWVSRELYQKLTHDLAAAGKSVSHAPHA
jgi:ribonuclease D